MNQNPVTPQSLIPRYWHVRVEKESDLTFLGKVTLRQLIRYWRSDADSHASRIKSLQARIDMIRGKSPSDFVTLAKGFESPNFAYVGKVLGGWGEIEPLDQASRDRASDATTFNFCGWCKYAGGGTCRYQYHISTHCGLLSDAGIKSDESRFNTPCFLPEASQKLLERITDGLIESLGTTIAAKHLSDQKIKYLITLERKAETKPAMPDHRPHDWFNVGDPVVCFVTDFPGRTVNLNLAKGMVVNGYRHHDGCVSVEFKVQIHEGENLGGKGGGYGMSRPEVMHKWELDYLHKHLDFAQIWATQGVDPDLKGFSSKKFLLLLAHDNPFLINLQIKP